MVVFDLIKSNVYIFHQKFKHYNENDIDYPGHRSNDKFSFMRFEYIYIMYENKGVLVRENNQKNIYISNLKW